jgi:hypothetical protein
MHKDGMTIKGEITGYHNYIYDCGGGRFDYLSLKAKLAELLDCAYIPNLSCWRRLVVEECRYH